MSSLLIPFLNDTQKPRNIPALLKLPYYYIFLPVKETRYSLYSFHNFLVLFVTVPCYNQSRLCLGAAQDTPSREFVIVFILRLSEMWP